MTRPINPELKLEPEAWAKLSKPERAAVSRILYETRRRAKHASERPGTMAQMDAEAEADVVHNAMINALNAARSST